MRFICAVALLCSVACSHKESNDPPKARELRALRNEIRSALERHGVPVQASTMELECLEVKDYMDPRDGLKASGWEAIKSVFQWWDTMIEVQVQPLANYQQERERLGHGGESPGERAWSGGMVCGTFEGNATAARLTGGQAVADSAASPLSRSER